MKDRSARVRALLGRTTTAACVTTTIVSVVLMSLRVINLEVLRPVVLVEAFASYSLLSTWVTAAISAKRRQWRIVAAAGAIAVIQGVSLVGAMPPAKARPPSGESIRLFDQNVEGSGNKTFPQTIETIKASRADVITLQEVTPQFQQALDSSGVIAGYPFRFTANDLAVFSKLPLAGARAIGDPRTRIIRMNLSLHDGSSVALYDVHMPTPLFEDLDLWTRAFHFLGDSLAADNCPALVAGDFNATTSHHAFTDLLTDGVTEAFEANGQGLDRTWPVKPGFMSSFGGIIRLDHVLLKRVGAQSVAVGAPDGSDHLPVTADLVVPPGGT